jgi:predicted permease
MGNFLIMFACLVAGQVIRRQAGFAIRDVRPINIVVLWISLPALILVEVPALFRAHIVNTHFLYAIAMPWLMFLAAAGGIILLAKWRSWDRKVVGALILTAGLGNTSFIGLPVLEAVFGHVGVSIGIMIDQLGTFLILATLGLVVASYCSGRELSAKVILRRVIFFPPFVAFVLAVALGVLQIPIDTVIIDSFKKIGGTLLPLALISVGWQLELNRATLRRYFPELSFGLGFKLILWPILVSLILALILSKTNIVYRVTVLEAAMAPMITGAVVAAEFDLESELAQLMVGIGIPISALTLFIWATVLKSF